MCIRDRNNHRKVRKGREIEFENFEIKVLDTKDGMAARIEMQILSQTVSYTHLDAGIV